MPQRLAYVNSDSILAHYDLVKSMREELEAKTIRLENELKTKQAAFEKDAAYFQEQVDKKSISGNLCPGDLWPADERSAEIV